MIMHCFGAVIMLMALLHASSAPAAAAARVAVLPFEIYSDESSKPLKDIIAGDLSARLASDNRLEVVDQARVREVMADRASLTFNETTLRTIAGKLDAPFLVLGSMTRIGANMSLDTYIFKVDGTPSFTKEFSEGKNLDTITGEVAAKVNARIVKLAPAPREEAGAQEKIAAVPPAADRPEKPLQDENLLDAAVEADAAEAAEEPGAVAPAAEELPREPAPVIASPRREEAAADPSPGKKGKEDRKEREDRKGSKGLSSPFTSSKPVKITAESLEADNKKNTVTFKGNVVAKQGDMVIIADTMTVEYEKEGGINTVQASGNVKMSQADRVATGTRIVFYNPEQKIVMTGNPKIWQGDNLISCDKITVLLEQDRIFFEGKVDSTIFPKSIQDAQKKDVKQVEAIPSGTGKP
jgi:lipopolysaccharide export system protein LptA